MSAVCWSSGLTEAQSAGAGLAAAALAARDPAALVRWRGGGRHRGSRDPTVAAVAQQFAWRAGATAGCRERREANMCTVVRHHSEWMRCWSGFKGQGVVQTLKVPYSDYFGVFSYFHSTRCCSDNVFFIGWHSS